MDFFTSIPFPSPCLMAEYSFLMTRVLLLRIFLPVQGVWVSISLIGDTCRWRCAMAKPMLATLWSGVLPRHLLYR